MSNLNLQKLREWVWPWPWTFNSTDTNGCKDYSATFHLNWGISAVYANISCTSFSFFTRITTEVKAKKLFVIKDDHTDHW